MSEAEGGFRVALKAIVFKEDGTILAMRRSDTAPSRPLGWDLPGGRLEYGEDATLGIQRETKEETGLIIETPIPFDVVARTSDHNEFWVTICYYARPTLYDVTLSYEHDKFKWTTPTEFKEMTTSTRQKQFAEKFEALQKSGKI